MLEALIFVVFPFCMVFAAVSDLLSMTIANRVPLLLIATFLVVAPLTGMSWADFAWHLAAFAVVLSATFALFAMGGMGGGDAKLMAATALFMGFGFPLVEYLVVSTLFGGILTVALLLYRNSALAVFTGHNVLTRNLANEKVGIPYAIALGAGGLFTYAETPLMQWALARLSGQG